MGQGTGTQLLYHIIALLPYYIVCGNHSLEQSCLLCVYEFGKVNAVGNLLIVAVEGEDGILQRYGIGTHFTLVSRRLALYHFREYK